MPSSTENSQTAVSPGSESRSEANPERAPASATREPWVRPRLECLGDVRELTMGTTQGPIESGAPGTFRV